MRIIRRDHLFARAEIDSYNRFWVASKSDDIRAVALNGDTFRSGMAGILSNEALAFEKRADIGKLFRRVVAMNEPDRRKYQLLTQAWLAPKNLGCVKEAGVHYPLTVITSILSVPEADELMMLRPTHECSGNSDEDLNRSLVMVAMQMKQNTHAIQLQNNYALGSGIAATESPRWATVVMPPMSSRSCGQRRSPTSRSTSCLYIDSVMNTAWNTWVAYQAGDASLDAWTAARQTVGGLFTYDAAKAIWNRFKYSYPNDFVSEIDAEFAANRADMHRDFRGMIDDIRKLEDGGA